ncbi:3-hydroxyisobutyrate dehydrogenase [Methylocystis sp. MJC1]|uniref:3-hydroxyisobutyrate dehydrogenase n=1 Tax=Methylocystis sp. MJC1 TaxID=2654282 RepID=UPI0013EAB38D|nr:3-hydroxyisobutyrate dehydrogenase [Methylocystis sp. MJC1]KAF2989851.1 putative 3-hydroxyisobutyrate dehydrogenase [Methylocystis sp. MJC1]MBU6528382.1 3-hydroxyisobutyrate dehydrogenase [Methylocystis sp. MJC1]UZX11284.1 3-hydroxyisobutyrate dehydrogenase [Methylocystis sp. MJC1]
MPRIAFIGLGAMGLPMAANLSASGYDIAGYDCSASAREKASSQGIELSESMKAAAEGADAVVTMLQNGDQVLTVWESLLGLAADALFIDCSTIDLMSAQCAHALARALGALSVDAPVSGGVAGAQAGKLTFMCGAELEAFEKAQPILQSMGARIVHCGGPGLGQAAKICNNLMLGVAMAATAEAFTLAEQLGLSSQALFDVASVSSGQSWSLTSYCPVAGLTPEAPANRGYKAGFQTKLMLKDLRLAETAAAGSGLETPMASAAARLYSTYESEGGGEHDFSGVIQAMRRR